MPKSLALRFDPEIIKIGKKYFGLDKIPGLKIVQTDAFDYVKKAKQNFDLIIVDLYLGDKFPPRAEEDKFLAKVKNLLSKDGMAIFNRLKINQNKLTFFEKKLRTHFSQVNLIKTLTNLFFLVRV